MHCFSCHTAGHISRRWRNLGGHLIPAITTCQNAALKTPIMTDPGTRWEYGTNIDFVGKAVEAVSGKRLDAYLRDNLFAPLGMSNTAFKITADMRIPEETYALIKEKTAGGDKYLHWFDVDITDEEGDVVAHVRRQVYYRLNQKKGEAQNKVADEAQDADEGNDESQFKSKDASTKEAD